MVNQKFNFETTKNRNPICSYIILIINTKIQGVPKKCIHSLND